MLESPLSTLFCRSVSFELELNVLNQIIIAPTNSKPLPSFNNYEQKEACPIIDVEKEDDQSQILSPKREEDEAELINHTTTNNKKSSSSDFRDLLINQLKFYASWYLLEITSPPPLPLPLPLPSTEVNVGSEEVEENSCDAGGLSLPLLHQQQNNVVIKIRGIAISKNKKPSRWTGLVSLLAAEHHEHQHPQNFLIGEGSFVKEINMKNLKSLFTKLLYSSSSRAAAAVVRQKRSSSSSSSSSNRRSVIDEIIHNSSSSSIEEGRRRYELVESEDISSRPDFCVDDYFSFSSSSSSANPPTSHNNKEKKLTVSIVDNLSLQDLIELKGAENLNAADICLFAKTKRLLEEEHQRVREEQYRLQQMRDKIFTGYKWPAHLDGINDKRYQKLYQWFKTYCCDLPPSSSKQGEGEEDFLLENNLLVTKGSTPLNRKKGLILFSKERRLGKSRFATSLVEDNPNWYIHCKGNFNKEAFINKPEAKLLIIDDFVYQESKHREIFKALISSEPTTIREAYMNYQFDHGLPTIICTNDGKFVKMASKSIYFKNDAYFTKIKEYMGPLNSRKSEEDDTIVQGNPDFWTYLEEEEEEEANTTTTNNNKRKRGSGNIKNGDDWRGDEHQQNIRGKKSATTIATTPPLLLQQLLLMEKKQPPQLYLSSSGNSPNLIPATTSGTEAVAVGSSKREFSPPLMSRLLNNQ